MYSLLVVALLKFAIPNGGPTDFAPFAYKEVARPETISTAVRHIEVHLGKPLYIDAIPLNIDVSEIGT